MVGRGVPGWAVDLTPCESRGRFARHLDHCAGGSAAGWWAGRSCFFEFCEGSLRLCIAFFQIKTGRDPRGAELEEKAQRSEVGTAGEPGGGRIGSDRHAPARVAVTNTSSDAAPFPSAALELVQRSL